MPNWCNFLLFFLFVLLSNDAKAFTKKSGFVAGCSTFIPELIDTIPLLYANLEPRADCQHGTFFALDDGTSKENNYCVTNLVALITSSTVASNIVSCVTYQSTKQGLLDDPFTAAFAESGAQASETGSWLASYAASMSFGLQTMAEAGRSVAKRVIICKVPQNDVWPSPYPDSHIRKLLEMSGEDPTPTNIIDKYNKICLHDTSTGEMKWLKYNECWSVQGVDTCVYAPDNVDPSLILCARTSQTCPCAVSSDLGLINPPNYETDSNGVYKTTNTYVNGVLENKLIIKDDGTIEKRSAEYYKYHAGRHCRAMRILNKSPKTPKYTGIIDDVCNSWSGYSKNKVTLTAGIVQCVVNTMRNMFEKPLGNGGSKTLTDDQNAVFDRYSKDLAFVDEAKTYIDNILSNSTTPNYMVRVDLTNLISAITKINNGIAFGINTGKGYINVPTKQVDQKYFSYIDRVGFISSEFYADIDEVGKGLDILLQEISGNKNDYLAQALENNSSKGFTPFQSVQGAMAGILFVVSIAIIIIMGYRMINFELSLNASSFMPLLIDFALIYYFALGTAWKDWLINFTINAANGFAQFGLEVTLNSVGNKDGCQFYQPYYIPSKNATKCDFLNPNGTMDISNVGYDILTGKYIRGCMKGPFIPMPQYEEIYKPVKYATLTAYGVEEDNWLPVYCIEDGNTSNRILANIEINHFTGDYIRLSCKNGYTMEDGYRVSELAKMGISSNNFKSKDSFGVVPTALTIMKGENIVNIVESIENDVLRVRTLNEKYKTKLLIESLRSYVNKTKRYYPVIKQYGVYRDMSFVAMFDTLDCKIMSYFGYSPGDNEDVMYVKFMIGLLVAFPFGWMIIILLLIFAVFLFSAVGKLTQTYIVSMSALMILLFISPIVIPLRAFSETKGFFDQWFSKVMAYLTNVPICMFTIGFIIVICDFSFYGPSSKYIENAIFNSDGTINQHCATTENLKTAPLVCLAYYFNNNIAWVGIGLSKITFPVPNVSSAYYGYIAKSLGIAIAIIFGVVFGMDGLEKAIMSQVGGADTSLSGSIFNTNTGLANHMMARAGATVKGIVLLPVDIAKKINTTVKDVKAGAKDGNKNSSGFSEPRFGIRKK